MRLVAANEECGFEVHENSGILYYTFTKPGQMDLYMVRSLINARMRITKGNPCYIINYMENLEGITREARSYLQERGGRGVVAWAVVARSPFERTIFQAYHRLICPNYPHHDFSNVEEAKEWLLEVKEQHDAIRP